MDRKKMQDGSPGEQPCTADFPNEKYIQLFVCSLVQKQIMLTSSQ